MQDNLKVTGQVDILINDKLVKHIPNLVVTKGRGFILSRMKEATKGVMSHIAIGTGTNAAAMGNTALQTEVERVALNTAPTISGDSIIYEATFGTNVPDTAKTITEAGIFNDDTTGDMLARTTFSAVNKATTDIMTIRWTITIS